LLNRKTAYACTSCSKSLLYKHRRDIFNSEYHAQIIKNSHKLDALFDWFMAVHSKKLLSTDINHWTAMNRILYWSELEETDFNVRANEIVHCWGDLVNQEPPINRGSLAKRIHSKIALCTFKSTKVTRLRHWNQSDTDHIYLSEVCRIYKAIRRYVNKRFRAAKCNCLTAREPFVKGKYSSYLCSLGADFKEWRKYWENHIKEIAKEALTSSYFKFDLGSKYQKKATALRIFALNCFWSFEDCISTAKENADDTCERGLQFGKKLPYWTISQENDHHVFHLWTDKSNIRNLSSGKCLLSAKENSGKHYTKKS